MHRSLKRKLVIGLAALAVAALAGGAYAATQSSTPNTRQAFLNDVAKRLQRSDGQQEVGIRRGGGVCRLVEVDVPAVGVAAVKAKLVGGAVE